MSGPQEIPIANLSLPQLSQLSQQLEKELELLQGSLAKLKSVQVRFSNSSEQLSVFKSENLNKEILVPLNSSIYVPGQLYDTQKVLVEVGTGYYVEMDVPKAKKHLKRKVDYLTEQMTNLQNLLEQKHQVKEVINDFIQANLQSHLEAKKTHA